MYNPNQPLDTFYKRLQKIKIHIGLIGNFPYVYLSRINGKRVTERTADSRYGFNIGFMPKDLKSSFVFCNTAEMFELIRKYAKNGK